MTVLLNVAVEKRKTGWRRPLVALAGVYLALVGGVRCFGDRMVFFPQVDAESRASPPSGVTEVAFQADDGVRLHGWWAERPGADWTFLVCHGNAGNVAGRADMLLALRKLGSVLLFDYRGYGESQGTPTEEGLYRDARAAWSYLTENRRIHPSKLIAYGQSLGSGVASRLAMDRKVAGLVLEAPFTSVPDMANAILPFPPVGWAMPVRMPTKLHVARAKVPLFVAHGTLDTVVPFAQGHEVFLAGTRTKRFFAIPGGGHNGLWANRSSELVREISQFLSEIRN